MTVRLAPAPGGTLAELLHHGLERRRRRRRDPCGLRGRLGHDPARCPETCGEEAGLEAVEQAAQVFLLFGWRHAVAGAAADFVENVAGALALHLVGHLDVVAIAALA